MSTCASCGAPLSVWHAACPVCGTPAATAASDPDAVTRAAAHDRLAAAASADYEIVRELGRGGMGWVFLARDRKLGRLAALKMLPAIDAMRAAALERFRREAETAARLTHPNIVPIYGTGGDLATPYFAMAYIEGESLAERLTRESRLDVAEAVRIAREVGAALAYAHRQGVVHRDVKPANVLLERHSGRALVTDFGVARGGDAAGLTQSGFAVGTPGYMAPEQAGGSPDVDARSDVYALGIMVFEMVTGRRFEMVDQGEWPLSTPSIRRALSGSRPDLPAAVAQAITRATAPKREDRFSTVEAMLEALGEPGAGGGRAHAPARRRAWQLGWLVVAAAAALALGRVAWLARRPATPPGTAAQAGGPPTIAVLRFAGDGAAADTLAGMLHYQLTGYSTVREADARVFAPPPGAAPTSSEVIEAARRAGAAWILHGLVGFVGPAGSGREVLVRAIEVSSARPVELGRFTTATLTTAAADSVILAVARSDVGRDLGFAPGTGMTASLEAVRAFTAAEAAFRRADYVTAVREYERVARLDTSYAIASYKRFLAALQAEPTEPALRLAVADMRRVIPHVGPREQRLLTAYLTLFDSADVAGAERQLRRVVADDSTFLDGWFALGEVRYHFGALAGLPADSADAAFTRALALWPDAAPAIMHKIALDVHAGREDSARANMARYLRLDSTSAVGRTVALGRLVLFGSLGDKRRVLDGIASLEDRVLEFGAINGATVARDRTDLVTARLALEEMTRPGRSRAIRSEGARFLVLSYLSEGRWTDAEREFARLRAQLPGDPELALLPDVIRALRAGVPATVPDTVRAMADDVARLAAMDVPHVPFGLVASQWLPRFRLARLTLARGDTAHALRLLEAQNFLAAFADQAVRGPSWLLQGRIHVARGDRGAAVRFLRRSANLLRYAEAPWNAVRDSANAELVRLGVTPP